jgi:long-chain acyl-CoA synthetase
MASSARPETLALQRLYQWEQTTPDKTVFTQPMGGGVVREWTWKQAVDEVRRMAAYLKGLNLEPGTRIALLAKNSAHWMMADWAIWMAGHVSVPLYPTLAANTVRQILDHSESKLLFVGKLDVWNDMKAGVPEGLPMITLPLAPKVDGAKSWDDAHRKAQRRWPATRCGRPMTCAP